MWLADLDSFDDLPAEERQRAEHVQRRRAVLNDCRRIREVIG